MDFSSEERSQILKVFTSLLKKVYGKGPQNIYMKTYENEVHIHLEGTLTIYAKYLIKYFGEESINMIQHFYEKSCYVSEKKIIKSVECMRDYRFYLLESDYENDKFIYKMKKMVSEI